MGVVGRRPLLLSPSCHRGLRLYFIADLLRLFLRLLCGSVWRGVTRVHPLLACGCVGFVVVSLPAAVSVVTVHLRLLRISCFSA